MASLALMELPAPIHAKATWAPPADALGDGGSQVPGNSRDTLWDFLWDFIVI